MAGAAGGLRALSTTAAPDDDIAALARGGRTNFLGFLLRLAARLPFLFIAGRLYGPELLGRFAYAVLIVHGSTIARARTVAPMSWR